MLSRNQTVQKCACVWVFVMICVKFVSPFWRVGHGAMTYVNVELTGELDFISWPHLILWPGDRVPRSLAFSCWVASLWQKPCPQSHRMSKESNWLTGCYKISVFHPSWELNETQWCQNHMTRLNNIRFSFSLLPRNQLFMAKKKICCFNPKCSHRYVLPDCREGGRW